MRSLNSNFGRMLFLIFLFFGVVFNSNARQVLKGHIPGVIAKMKLQPLGRLDKTMRLHLAIGLPLRDQTNLNDELRDLYDPANPSYHRYLTPTQFASQFGPSEGDYAALIAFANANGLSVTQTHLNRVLLDVSGTVSDIEKAFHVKMQVYRHPSEARTFYAPDAEPSVELATPILHVSGLDNSANVKPFATAPRPIKGKKLMYGTAPSGFYWGADFRKVYAPGDTLTGAGQVLGLVELDGYDTNDIIIYEDSTHFSKNVPLKNVLIDGYDGHRNDSGVAGQNAANEVCVDIEMAISMAPGLSNLVVYEASPSDGHFEDILNAIATDTINLPNQVSCSWGIDTGAFPVDEQILQEMAIQGQSFLQASGDSDAWRPSQEIPYPADSPNLTLCGGTFLTTTSGGAWSSEAVWNFWPEHHIIGSGGGISPRYSLPTWQTGDSNASNKGSTTHRMTPDVACVCDSIAFVEDRYVTSTSGTSFAAPLWAGFIALANEQAATSGAPPVGFINPRIYAIGKGTGYGSTFHDVTIGNNEDSLSTTKFPAVTGYDLASGWGTPKGQALIDSLVPVFPVTVNQKLSTGTSVGTIGRWNGRKFPTARISPGSTMNTYIGHTEVLQGDQSIHSGQKYNQWQRNGTAEATVVNHHQFVIQSSDNNFLSSFASTNNATLQGALLETGSTTSSVNFQDPWLIDYADPNYGNTLRNEGMSAPFKSVSYAVNNLSTSPYQGVLLNQLPSSAAYYSVSTAATQTIGGYASQFSNWSSPSATFQSPTATQSSLYFTASGATVTANYKGIHISNTSTTFANNSQRKFVRTYNGNLHMVYESAGHVWYEISTNSGSSWTLANGGQPLDANGGKSPAIDCQEQSSDVVIVWQENYSSGAVELRVAHFVGGTTSPSYFFTVFQDASQYYAWNLNPVIAYDYEERACVVWQNRTSTVHPVGLILQHCLLGSGGGSNDTCLHISGTDTTCVNPTIAVAKYPTDQYNMRYNIAWQVNQSSSASIINYCMFKANSGVDTAFAVVTASSGSGFQQNWYPSIAAMNDNTARLVWDAYAPWYGNRWAYNYTNTSWAWSGTVLNEGSSVTQSYVNSTDTGTFVIGWVQNSPSLTNSFVKSDNLYAVKNLSTAGNNLQINNAASWSTMYVMPYQNTTLPYPFILSANTASYAKTTSSSVNNGRGAVVTHNGNGYCFGVGDITVDGQSIAFAPLVNVATIPTADSLNHFLKTNDFNVTTNSNISLTVFHGMAGSTDTGGVVSSFGATDYVNADVNLVNSATGATISTLANCQIAKGAVFTTNITGYEVSCAALGASKVRLELVIDDDIPSTYEINDFVSSGTTLATPTDGTVKVRLKASNKITSFSLSQNYPEPFNPSTTLDYALPAAGYVTMLVYNSIGQQVAKLIDGEKAAGSYSVRWNAGNNTSGTYFVQIKVADLFGKPLYQGMRKMLLVK